MTPLEEYNARHETFMAAWAAEIRRKRRSRRVLILTSAAVGAFVGLSNWMLP